MGNRARAKQIIQELVRLSGGMLHDKLTLSKLFYFAHLYFAHRAPDYLSDWAIVRAPSGPAIHDFDNLMAELIAEASIEERRVSIGPYNITEYRTVREEEVSPPLSREALTALADAVAFVKGKTTTELSELTSAYSRSWKLAKDGDELNIYIDLLTDQEYQHGIEQVDRITSVLGTFWKEKRVSDTNFLPT